VVLKTFSSVGAHAGGAQIGPDIRAPATVLAEFASDRGTPRVPDSRLGDFRCGSWRDEPDASISRPQHFQ
jgi:hypothetical protein